jgi:hypothetical protein
MARTNDKCAGRFLHLSRLADEIANKIGGLRQSWEDRSALIRTRLVVVSENAVFRPRLRAATFAVPVPAASGRDLMGVELDEWIDEVVQRLVAVGAGD